MNKLSLSGLILLLFGLCLALVLRSPFWYSFFVVGGFFALEGINRRYGFSVLGNRKNFLRVWLIAIVIALIAEIIGNFWLHLWRYPAYDALSYTIHVIVVGYTFTIFFGLIFFTFIERMFKGNYRFFLLPIAALFFGYVNEYPNTLAHEWIYTNWPSREFLGIPLFVSILWMALLAILPFKKYFYLDE